MIAVEGGKAKEIGRDVIEGVDASGIVTISTLQELRIVWPDIFKG